MQVSNYEHDGFKFMTQNIVIMLYLVLQVIRTFSLVNSVQYTCNLQFGGSLSGIFYRDSMFVKKQHNVI